MKSGAVKSCLGNNKILFCKKLEHMIMNNFSGSLKSTPPASDSGRQSLLTTALAMAETMCRRARRALIDFVLATLPAYKPGFFHRELADALDTFLADVEAGRSPRLIIMAPPQHGKSELVSRRFPAYAHGRNPNLRVIATSYNAQLAENFSRDVQKIHDDPTYQRTFPDARIAGSGPDSGQATRQAGFFEIVGHRGYYLACGVGGGITGRTADIAIVDDPFKGYEEANSEQTREAIWKWYATELLTRVREGGGIIVVMTRWHQDDLVGRLLKAQQDGGEAWRVLCFPAIAEQDEPHRREGEALCPELFSLETLEQRRKILGPSAFAALYQQRPVPAEGGIIKESSINYYDVVPNAVEEYVQSWDLSFKGAANCDFVAGHVWARQGGNYYLLDRVHARLDFDATIKAIKALSSKWPCATAKYVEEKANGPAVISTLRGDLDGVIRVQPQGSKESRVHAVSPLFAAGNVFLPHPSIAPWVNEVVDEFINFPHGKHDDDVDAMTQALLQMRCSGPPPWQVDLRPVPGLREGVLSSTASAFPMNKRQQEVCAKVLRGEALTDEDEDAMIFGDLP